MSNLHTISPAPRLQRIRHQSRWMARACTILMVTLPLALVFYWATTSAPQQALLHSLPGSALPIPFQTWQRWACGLVNAVPLCMMLLGLWQARRCFAQFANGQVFTVLATQHLRRFAQWVAAAAVAAIVAGAATSVLVTLHNPPGMRHLAISVSSSHVLTVFFAALVWLMADIIGQGQSLAEENQAFV